MIETLKAWWQELRSQILFIPGLLVFFGMGLAVAMVEIDRSVGAEPIRGIPWLFGGGASGARDVLATIATAMAQLAGITFSVTIVALALRSQQFGPRLLRNFTRDTANQVVLGTFLGTFVYALLVLRSVRDLEDATFVPLLAITGAILLALVSLGFFIFFIDKIVDSIQATSIIAQAAEETHAAIDSLFPESLGEDGYTEGDELEHPPLADAVPVLSRETGYIQTLANKKLIELASKADIVVRMEAPIGGFIVKGTPLASVSPRSRVDEKLLSKIWKTYQIGRHRSVTSDPEFGIRQVVDVAVKALSPSMNDPTTAVTTTEYVGALVIDFATRSIPSNLRMDYRGTLRVIAIGPTFRQVADLAFDQIREYGSDSVAVVLALLDSIIRVAGAVRAEPRKEILVSHVWKISRAAAKAIPDPVDREAVNRRLRLAMESLGRGESDAMHYLLPLKHEG
ncbi:MAG: DUF2254 domain-containing protein [Gemmatimonadetes bacterium]|nr:DUF2254 domain-containing protein [Gemmatimonadota bacterium]